MVLRTATNIDHSGKLSLNLNRSLLGLLLLILTVTLVPVNAVDQSDSTTTITTTSIDSLGNQQIVTRTASQGLSLGVATVVSSSSTLAPTIVDTSGLTGWIEFIIKAFITSLIGLLGKYIWGKKESKERKKESEKEKGRPQPGITIHTVLPSEKKF